MSKHNPWNPEDRAAYARLVLARWDDLCATGFCPPIRQVAAALSGASFMLNDRPVYVSAEIAEMAATDAAQLDAERKIV